MSASDIVASPPAAASADDLSARPRSGSRMAVVPVFAVVAVTAVGAVLRVIVAHQSVFADELSTYWISVTHSLSGVLSLLYSTGRIQHAEITPPLSFLASWLSTRPGSTVELLRAPALLAGTATIPLVYLLGRRSVGRRAGLLAATLTALSPFMIYYSAEARAYGPMMFLLTAAVLSMLLAIDTRRGRYWALYAAFSAAAFYTHYTCAFVLAVALVWVLWSEPAVRRQALLANAGAALLVVPWIPGLIADLNSPTVKILSALSPFTINAVRLDIQHWALGFPYTVAGGLRDLPGVPALLLLTAAAVLSAVGLGARARGVGRVHPRSLNRRIVLMVALMLATPLGEVVGSLSGNHIIGVRDLAASWPFLALCVAALVTAAGSRLGIVAAALTVAAFALGAAKLFEPRFARPDYQAAADYVARQARSEDVVLDMTPTPGPLTGLDVTLHRHLAVFRALQPAETDHPFGFSDPIVPLRTGVMQAVAAADGARVFVVTAARPGPAFRAQLEPISEDFPARYRLVTVRVWIGLEPTLVAVYARDRARPK